MPPEGYARIPVSLPPARRRRTIDQRLQARKPRLTQAVVAMLRRFLPPRSRLRQAVTMGAVLSGYDAYNRRDWDVVLGGYDPWVEIRLHHVEGVDGVHHGHDGLRQYWRLWFDAWEESRMEPTEVIDFQHQLLVLGRIECRGRSGLELHEPLAALFTIRRGAVVRHEEWFDHSAGLEAVGLTAAA